MVSRHEATASTSSSVRSDTPPLRDPLRRLPPSGATAAPPPPDPDAVSLRKHTRHAQHRTSRHAPHASPCTLWARAGAHSAHTAPTLAAGGVKPHTSAKAPLQQLLCDNLPVAAGAANSKPKLGAAAPPGAYAVCQALGMGDYMSTHLVVTGSVGAKRDGSMRCSMRLRGCVRRAYFSSSTSRPCELSAPVPGATTTLCLSGVMNCEGAACGSREQHGAAWSNTWKGMWDAEDTGGGCVPGRRGCCWAGCADQLGPAHL